ncbi:hypothetical protein V8C43DRAFT_271595 [Trichoderma afarasin]
MQGTRRRRFVLGNLFGVSMLRLCIYKVAASSRDQMPLFLRQTAVKHSNRTDTLNNYISSLIHTYIYPWDISSVFSLSPQLFHKTIYISSTQTTSTTSTTTHQNKSYTLSKQQTKTHHHNGRLYFLLRRLRLHGRLCSKRLQHRLPPQHRPRLWFQLRLQLFLKRPPARCP